MDDVSSAEGDYYVTLMMLHCGHGPERCLNVWYIEFNWEFVRNGGLHEVELRHMRRDRGRASYRSAHEAAKDYCKFYNLIPTEVTIDGG